MKLEYEESGKEKILEYGDKMLIENYRNKEFVDFEYENH